MLVTGGIVKKKKTGCKAIGLGFKYINGFLNLSQQIISGKITIMIFTSLEYYYTGLANATRQEKLVMTKYIDKAHPLITIHQTSPL